jgi:hypothetical protein
VGASKNLKNSYDIWQFLLKRKVGERRSMMHYRTLQFSLAYSSVFLSLCIGIKADPVGQVSNPFAKLSIQQIEQDFPVEFVSALRFVTSGKTKTTVIDWVFKEKWPLARPHTLDIPLMIQVWESPSYMEFSSAMLAVDDEARYLSEHNLLLVAPSVQERKTDPQPIAEWLAGPKPAEDDQHRIANGWETLMSQWGQQIRDDYPDLHFVRGEPVTLIFRYDINVWCWSATYVVGVKNNEWLSPFLGQNPAKDATDLVMEAFIYVRQGTIFDTQLNFQGLRDATKYYPGL